MPQLSNGTFSQSYVIRLNTHEHSSRLNISMTCNAVKHLLTSRRVSQVCHITQRMSVCHSLQTGPGPIFVKPRLESQNCSPVERTTPPSFPLDMLLDENAGHRPKHSFNRPVNQAKQLPLRQWHMTAVIDFANDIIPHVLQHILPWSNK